MSQTQVLLVGYNGANNTGAEALLLSDIEDVRAVLGVDVQGEAGRRRRCRLGNQRHVVVTQRLQRSFQGGVWVADERRSYALIVQKLAQAVCNTSTPTWPHTFVVPRYATMVEYKQYPPANHFHMTWDLPVARLQYWMDLTGVLSVTPW